MTKTLQNHLFPLLLSGIVLIMAILPHNVENLLILHRQSFLSGEVWRAISGHLLHLDWPHLLMNLTGLWVTVWLAENLITTLEWFVTFAISSLLISSALLMFSNIDWYVGLSGVLHSFLVLVACKLIIHKRAIGWLLLLLILLKIGWEQWQGASPELEQLIGGKVILNAHLFGAIAGLAIAPLLPLFKRA
ncbi:MAG: rhombosortase [Candidatus Polarisedimenticolaceae bacterium]|nr:rhombosortase [Gammaproteobacteria bacterium]MCF6282721.1 rhombosortase [Candidatus Polarisedimenticolaceae bacterium]